MKKLVLTLVLLPLLAACESGATVTYDVTTSVTDAERHSALLFAAMRVIERRMTSVGEEIVNLDLNRPGNKEQITLTVNEEAALGLLTQELTADFTLAVMEEAEEETADIVVEGHGGFSHTGLTKEDVEWLTSSEEVGGKGRVTIEFTAAGRSKMADIFAKNNGKFIGIFVRDHLVSKLLVETDQLKDDIVITDIPTANLAEIFADDVNVGMHLTFTPVP